MRNNKYLYLFIKDSFFRTLCLLSVVGVVLCLVLIRLLVIQYQEYKDIQDKQALIAQIPALQARIVQTKVLVNGVTLTLNGIISNNAQPMAVVNNTLIKVGGVIDGKKVTAITGHSTTLCDVKAVDKCITLLIEH